MKISTKNKIDKLLNSAKLKKTTPRMAILEVLLKANRPKSAEELMIEGKSGPNKVTVYRTLKSLINAGVIHRAFLSKEKQYYELADKCSEHQCHPHFICTGCGKTSCLHGASVSMAKNTPAGFVIRRQQTRLEGLCPKCA